MTRHSLMAAPLLTALPASAATPPDEAPVARYALCARNTAS